MNLDAEDLELLGVPATTPGLSMLVRTQGEAGAAASSWAAAHDAADLTNQLAPWQTAIRSADDEILPELSTLTSRARDTLRNDAYIAGASTINRDAIVGGLYLLAAKPATKVLWGRADDVWEAEFQEEVEAKFMLWAESPQCWIDAGRRNTLTELVRLGLAVYDAGGEVLASAEWRPDDGRPFRVAIQMIDIDRLATPPLAGLNHKIRGGVERDKFGAPVAYHIRQAHPTDYRNPDFWDFRRVMARKPWGRPMILHAFEQKRPDQTRGVAAMASAMGEMRMTKKFRETELQRAIVASTYGASIESDMPPSEVFAALGGENQADAYSTWASTFLAAVNEYSGGAKNMRIDGARIPIFMPGTKLKLQNAGTQGPSAGYEASLLRYLATACNLSYEQLSRDYTATNYSSARAAMGETWKHHVATKKLVADRIANFAYRLWLEEAINYNALETLKRRNVPNYYEGLNAEAFSACDWIGAGRMQVDPLKETQASALLLKSGLTTKSREIAALHGSDWRGVAVQISRERALDEKLGNPSVYDQDTQEQDNALSGTPQERES